MARALLLQPGDKVHVNPSTGEVNPLPEGRFGPPSLAPAIHRELIAQRMLAAAHGSTCKVLRFLFDGPPGPVAGRFVETEDINGHGVSVGEWHEEPPYWVLYVPIPVNHETPPALKVSIEGEASSGRTSILAQREPPIVGPGGYIPAELNSATQEGLRQLHLVYKRLSEWCEREIRIKIELEKGNAKMAAVLGQVNEELYISLPPWARW